MADILLTISDFPSSARKDYDGIMKTAFPLLFAAFAMVQPLRSAEPSFEVHEWGTMTTVSGSDGLPLQWYQPSADLAGLPAFVGINPFQSKGRPAAVLRMETPVIYFYPGQAMTVSASVAMPGGRITEWFPWPTQFGPMLLPSAQPPQTIRWQGVLVPPNDKAALAEIPPVNQGPGNHYVHARNVPEAWIFKSADQVAHSPSKSEKFIFYRGAGEFATPVQIASPNDRVVTLMNGHVETLRAAFVLKVSGSQGGWAKLAPLEGGAKSPGEIAVPPADKPVETMVGELGQALRSALTGAGLTPPEAAAMVDTWKDAWFKEPGTRVLYLLPESWINSVLPLTITPAPSKMKRVFLARLEVFTPEQERTLATLLDQPISESRASELAPSFHKLQLGRFGSAGLERAIAMKRSALQSAYQQLEAQAQKLPPPQVEAPKVSAR
jgi:hypothetical protein